MDVGNQIRYYRKDNDLSQAELAEKIFVSSQTISNWENERSYPDLHNLIELASLFNVSLDQLVKGDVKMMRNAVDHSNMGKYSRMILVFLLLTVISFGAAMKFSDGWFGMLVPLILWMISMYYAIKVDQIKKKHDVKTYKEIIDYMENGMKTDQTPRNKKKFIMEEVFTVLGFSLIAVILVLFSMFIFGAL
ncbi:helix-turn-helix domain-containing protein [Macrococcoides canis]|uniref:Cro/C1-type helix-turn-helix domain containing transcriptional regulator n=1 Tax=Macrococcoides canis TaxID=1855823 RepID=A0A4Y1NMP2_9STAP|nr:helix-turn-helix transcriptional regulator [Macrococcus canis]AXE74969.1 Cro/C1-type helix-turn-helix domain containing transcriptional regulator [Macrococcus canis]QIH77106.1 helix-turn-helix domain-containing protein [Macrococcus canis]